MLVTFKDKNIFVGEIVEDDTNNWGLYIVPNTNSEICIEEKELRTALKIIDANKISKS